MIQAETESLMLKKYKYMALGCITYVPKAHDLLRRGTGGTTSSHYCYSVWLRHLVSAAKAGLSVSPAHVAELGPGDSIGIGLAALISGADTYSALDAVPHAVSERNIAVFDDLVELFRRREPIPGPEEFPRVRPTLGDYSFPDWLLPASRLDMALAQDRIGRLRADLIAGTGAIRYIAPWNSEGLIKAGSIDLIVSQAVLEHVDDLPNAYRSMARWLRPGGYMSHQIDFKCHGMAEAWNGHLGYSDRTWKIMRGRLPYLLNRKVYSEHLAYMRDAGFVIRSQQIVESSGGLSGDRLAPRFRHIEVEDSQVSDALIQAELAR